MWKISAHNASITTHSFKASAIGKILIVLSMMPILNAASASLSIRFLKISVWRKIRTVKSIAGKVDAWNVNNHTIYHMTMYAYLSNLDASINIISVPIVSIPSPIIKIPASLRDAPSTYILAVSVVEIPLNWRMVFVRYLTVWERRRLIAKYVGMVIILRMGNIVSRIITHVLNMIGMVIARCALMDTCPWPMANAPKHNLTAGSWNSIINVSNVRMATSWTDSITVSWWVGIAFSIMEEHVLGVNSIIIFNNMIVWRRYKDVSDIETNNVKPANSSMKI